MRTMLLSLALLALVLYQWRPELLTRYASAAEVHQSAPRPLTDDFAALELRRQQLAEKEAALKAKEDALGRLAAKLDARVIELNAAKKAIEGALVARKAEEEERRKKDAERYKKMIKIYKTLKAADAAELMNKLEPKLVIEMLNQMDQKTAVKLIPFITQPRVLEWTRLNLTAN